MFIFQSFYIHVHSLSKSNQNCLTEVPSFKSVLFCEGFLMASVVLCCAYSGQSLFKKKSISFNHLNPQLKIFFNFIVIINTPRIFPFTPPILNSIYTEVLYIVLLKYCFWYAFQPFSWFSGIGKKIHVVIHTHVRVSIL